MSNYDNRELIHHFIHDIKSGFGHDIGEGVDFSSLLCFIANNPNIHLAGYIDLQSIDNMVGLLQTGNYHIQVNQSSNSGKLCHYELIIVDSSDDGNKKRMAVLTAESLESELVEMDCSGMRENVIIDLNRGGRRWEGGELNGKPFGFGYEYSENDNLVYEGFVFEGMKVCFGKEWSDDDNNNCLVYEGGYLNEER